MNSETTIIKERSFEENPSTRMTRSAFDIYFRYEQRRQFLGFVFKALTLSFVVYLLFLLDSNFVFWQKLGLYLLISAISLALFLIADERFPLSRMDVAKHLNRFFNETEESSDLFLRDSQTLTLLERLQVQKVNASLHDLMSTKGLSSLHPPVTLKTRFFFFGAVALSAFLLLFPKSNFRMSGPTPLPSGISTIAPKGVSSIVVRVSPPPYTNLHDTTWSSFNFTTVEGAKVHWQIAFQRVPQKSILVFNSRDTIALQPVNPSSEKSLIFEEFATLRENAIYSLYVDYGDGFERSELYAAMISPDSPPTILVSSPKEARTTIDGFKFFSQPFLQNIEIQASLTDDYGISKSEIVATVAKGTGENVKFRESRFPFSKQEGSQYGTSLNLKSLGMGAGDELYFFIEATDNRIPFPHKTRSDIYFISITDTAIQNESESLQFSIKVKPEYFRSQRQIIIDTEKLIQDRKSKPTSAFGERSEEIGVDQKVLRLRYGKFLGEEFESVIGKEALDEEVSKIKAQAAADSSKTKEHPLMRFVKHVHDENCGHNAASSQSSEPEKPKSSEDLMMAFAHIHDTEEGATFYSDDIKAQLKAALAEMWNAELYLRMHEPQKALPFEYKALRIIKDLQQKSRIYVQRVGFESPPLKPEEKRFTGELDKIQNPKFMRRGFDRDSLKFITESLQLFSYLRRSNATPPDSLIDALELAAVYVNRKSLENPLAFLSALKSLRLTLDLLHTHVIPSEQAFAEAEKILWKLIPATRSPIAKSGSSASPFGVHYQELLRRDKLGVN
ncbi:MAG: hypothetical protein SFU91_07875 [Chloroherpetonaceae bacterium]|nr:hypothetical protein [Chloroherpetonaceae bacterium]